MASPGSAATGTTADFFAFRPTTGEVVVVMGNQTGESQQIFERAQALATR